MSFMGTFQVNNKSTNINIFVQHSETVMISLCMITGGSVFEKQVSSIEA